MSQLLKQITDESFEVDVLQSKLPVLVDFWADWCPPCKAMNPIVEEIAKEYAGKLTILELDTEDNLEMPAKFGFRGIPTFALFKNGALLGFKVGQISKSELIAFIKSHI
jgi:thioredoxin 1